jgi:hypothetical protein
MIVTAVAIPLMAMAGLGAEAGSWYLIRRSAQNAADSAAYAGAIALIANQSVTTKGAAFATQNGFTDGATLSTGATQTVTITAAASSVTAVITQYQPPLLASLFLSGPVPITARAVASVAQTAPPCALSLSDMTIGGSQSFTGGSCSLLANTTVRFNGGPTFSGSGWEVDATKGCIGPHCSPLPTGVSSNYSSFPTKIPTALANLESDSSTGAIPLEPKSPTNIPNCNNGQSCTYTQSAAWQGNLNIKNGGTAYLSCPTSSCTFMFDSLSVNGTLQLAPGTTGVNIIIGQGGLSINGIVNLTAASSNSSYPDMGGVLIYDTETNNNLTINGTSTSVYGGALYFPNAAVTWNGNSASNNHCTQLVANSLTFTGDTSLDVSGCVPGTVPQSQVVLLTS